MWPIKVKFTQLNQNIVELKMDPTRKTIEHRIRVALSSMKGVYFCFCVPMGKKLC